MTTALLVEWAVEAAEKRIIPFTLFTFFPSPMLTFWDYVFPSRPFGALCKRFYCILQHLLKYWTVVMDGTEHGAEGERPDRYFIYFSCEMENKGDPSDKVTLWWPSVTLRKGNSMWKINNLSVSIRQALRHISPRSHTQRRQTGKTSERDENRWRWAS